LSNVYAAALFSVIFVAMAAFLRKKKLNRSKFWRLTVEAIPSDSDSDSGQN
jgi:hypothetical protein